MKLIYSSDPAYSECCEEESLFLVGPTPRSKDVPSWRPDAIKALEELNYEGIVCIPERKDWQVKFTYEDQVEWEAESLEHCLTIVAWVPRDLQTMPAFTTNVEFGYWMGNFPDKMFYGRPDGAPNTRYLDWLYNKRTGRTPSNNLKDTLKEAISWMTFNEENS